MRPRTITVDISRGADYALWDYRRQSSRWWPLRCTLQGFARAMAEMKPLILKVRVG